MTATHPRGQAAVELALGSLVLVTVLLFGLQFGELLFVSLKVQESAITTRWDGTGQRTHRLPADFSLAPVAVANAGREGQSRHRDFDGRSSKRGSPWLVQAATAAHGMAVSCELKPMLKFPAGGIPPRWAGVYQDPGGLSCDAKAEVTVIRIPNEFAEGGSGFFQARHQGGPLTFSACGFGRPFAPSCSAGPAVLLDDWALTGADEGKECVLIDAERCKNPGYYASVEKLFTYGGRGKGDAASALARGVVGSSPIDPNTFWLSFRGEESDFHDCVPDTKGEGPIQWVTTPGKGSPVPEYDLSYAMRGACALGERCF